MRGAAEVLVLTAAIAVGCGGGGQRSAFVDERGDTHGKASPAKAAPAKAAPTKAAALPDKIGLLPLASKAVPILRGRLHVRLPAEAQPVAADEIGAGPDEGPLVKQTRHRLQLVNQKVLFLEVELFAREGPDFISEVREEIGRWGQRAPTFEVGLVSNPQVSVIRVIPSEPLALGLRDGIDDLSLVGVLFVASVDGSIQTIAAHANQAALADRAGLVSFLNRIGATLRPGRRLSTTSGTRTFTLFRRGPEVRIDVPDGVASLEQQTPEQETYMFYMLRPLGGVGGTARIVVGGRPEPPPARGGRRVPGNLLGAAAPWVMSTGEGGELGARAVQLAGEQPVEAVITANGPAPLDALRQMAETMRFSRACQAPADCPAGERCDHEYCRSGSRRRR